MTRKHCNINPCGLAACSMYMCVCISVVKVLCIAHVVHRETHVPMTEVSLLIGFLKFRRVHNPSECLTVRATLLILIICKLWAIIQLLNAHMKRKTLIYLYCYMNSRA